jgi:hypothetical protein
MNERAFRMKETSSQMDKKHVYRRLDERNVNDYNPNIETGKEKNNDGWDCRCSKKG